MPRLADRRNSRRVHPRPDDVRPNREGDHRSDDGDVFRQGITFRAEMVICVVTLRRRYNATLIPPGRGRFITALRGQIPSRRRRPRLRSTALRATPSRSGPHGIAREATPARMRSGLRLPQGSTARPSRDPTRQSPALRARMLVPAAPLVPRTRTLARGARPCPRCTPRGRLAPRARTAPGLDRRASCRRARGFAFRFRRSIEIEAARAARLHRLTCVQAVANERVHEIVRFGNGEAASGSQLRHHPRDRSRWVGEVDQDRLAGHEIEITAVRFERHRITTLERHAHTAGKRARKGASPLDPSWLSIQAEQRRLGVAARQDLSRPVSRAAADVQHSTYLRESPPPRHEIEEVVVPPKVPLRTQVVGGVRLVGRHGCAGYSYRQEDWLNPQPSQRTVTSLSTTLSSSCILQESSPFIRILGGPRALQRWIPLTHLRGARARRPRQSARVPFR